MKREDFRCPGQNTMFWKPGDIYEVKCPNCGRPVEFWKDDAKRTCTCGHRFLNPRRDIGCLEWCRYAEKCMPEMFQGENLRALYRDRLLAAVKAAARPEEKTVEYTLRVLEAAEEILADEGGEPKVVIAAIIVQDLLGASAGDSGGRTRKILAEMNTETEVIDQVLGIIQNAPQERGSRSPDLDIVSDARNVVMLAEKKALLEKPALEQLLEKKLKTEAGKRLARERLLQ